MVCYCGGDIDDCEFNGEGSGQETCMHRCDLDGGEDDGFDGEDRDMPEPLMLGCSYPGCFMPAFHFPSECHNAEDIEQAMRCERVEKKGDLTMGAETKRPEGTRFEAAGIGAASARVMLADKKGGDMAEWPEELRVREFPK
jgi:hypothetical protein